MSDPVYRVPEVVRVYASGEAVDASEINMEAIAVTLLIREQDVQPLLDGYDPSSGTSPSVGTVRDMARAILDAILERQPL